MGLSELLFNLVDFRLGFRISEKMNLKPSVQNHLRNVYSHLSLMFLVSTISSVLYLEDALPRFLVEISIFSTFVSFLGFYFSSQKFLFSLVFAFFKGISLGPLLDFASLNPSTIPLALASTLLILISFTASVVLTPSTSFIKVGGLLGSLFSVTCLLSLLNLFFQSQALFSVELYAGLISFSLFLIHDTQGMIEKAEMGSRDYLLHSMELYVDVIAIFTRLLVILMKKDQEKDSSKKKKKVN